MLVLKHEPMDDQLTETSDVSVCGYPNRWHVQALHLRNARYLQWMARIGMRNWGLVHVHVHHCAGYEKRRAILRIEDRPVSRDSCVMRCHRIFSRGGGRRVRAWRWVFHVLIAPHPGLWSLFPYTRNLAGTSPGWGARALRVHFLHQSAFL